MDLIDSHSFPVRCTTNLVFDSAPACLYALSPAIVEFDKCVGATEESLGTAETVLSSTSDRCTAQQIMRLDGKYHLYVTLMNAGVFNVVNNDFVAELNELPCRQVIEDWVAVLTTNKNDLIGDSKCGTSANQVSKQISSNCRQAGGSLPGASLQLYVISLRDELGGGFTIDSQYDNRCSSNEITVLSSLAPYGQIAKCSLTLDPWTPSQEDSWAECVDTIWPSFSDSVVSDEPFGCADCFKNIAFSIKELRGTVGDLQDCSSTDPFGTACINELQSNGVLDNMYQCAAIDLNTMDPICSEDQMSSVSSMLKSVIPFISLAKSVVDDSTLVSIVSKKAAAIQAIDTLDGYQSMNISSIPCISCFGGLVSSLVDTFSNVPFVSSQCDDVYAPSCTDQTSIADLITRFEACSNITLTTTSSYTCSDDQFQLISNKDIPQYLYNQALISNSSMVETVMIEILLKVAEIMSENNIEVPCVTCLQDVVVGLFGLSDNIKSVCSVSSPATCLGLPGVSDIAQMFNRCSGQALNKYADATTAAPIDESSSTTTSTNSAITIGWTLISVMSISATALIM